MRLAAANDPSDSFAAFRERKTFWSVPTLPWRCIRGDLCLLFSSPSSSFCAVCGFVSLLGPAAGREDCEGIKDQTPQLVSFCLGCRPAALLSLPCRTSSPALLCLLHLFITFLPLPHTHAHVLIELIKAPASKKRRQKKSCQKCISPRAILKSRVSRLYARPSKATW